MREVDRSETAPFGLYASWGFCTDAEVFGRSVGDRGWASRSRLAPLDLPSSVGFADIFSRKGRRGRGVAANEKWPVQDSFEEATPKLPQTGRPHGPGRCGGPEHPARFCRCSDIDRRRWQYL